MSQSGVSLIETLISLFILSLLLLGFDAMQITALKEAKSAYYYSVATQQLNVMTERLRALSKNNYNDQFTIWNQQNQEVLPQGKGLITGYYPDFNLAIFWGNGVLQECIKNKIGQSGCLHLSIKI